MATEDAALSLRETGVALLRGVLVADQLIELKESAERCFAAVESGVSLPERCGYNRFSHSVLLAGLLDFGCDAITELLDPVCAPAVQALIAQEMGGTWSCHLEHSWVRKKLAVRNATQAGQVAQAGHQNWHQDGALGVRFPAEPGVAPPMTELLTCWVALDACGRQAPGLEFVRGRQPELLHFTELDDAAVRARFAAELFWAPELEAGDALLFANSVLHRTYTQPAMRHDRLSVEYRVFPRGV